MAGCVFLCTFLCFFSVIFIVFSLGNTFYDSIKNIIYWGFWIFLYGTAVSICTSSIAFMVKFTHKLGIEIVTIKERNKFLNTGDELKSNLGKIYLMIALNLIFLTILGLLANYFQVWYVKYTLVAYICFVFGYVAAYPLTDDENKSLINYNGGAIMDKITMKTIANSSIFFTMYMGYHFYS
jgi:hypothetical protein